MPGQKPRVAHGEIEIGVADVDEHRMRRLLQDVHPRFDNDAECALGAADKHVEIERTLGIADVGQIVARKAAIELGKAGLDPRRVLALERVDSAVYRSRKIVPCLDGLKLVVRKWRRAPDRAIRENRREF